MGRVGSVECVYHLSVHSLCFAESPGGSGPLNQGRRDEGKSLSSRLGIAGGGGGVHERGGGCGRNMCHIQPGVEGGGTSNRLLTESPCVMRKIQSAIKEPTDRTLILSMRFSSGMGMVFRTTSYSCPTPTHPSKHTYMCLYITSEGRSPCCCWDAISGER